MKTNIDNFIKERLKGHQVKASKLLWYRLAINHFLHTFLGKISAYAIIIISIGTIAFLFTSTTQEGRKYADNINETTIKKDFKHQKKSKIIEEIQSQTKPSTSSSNNENKIQETHLKSSNNSPLIQPHRIFNSNTKIKKRIDKSVDKINLKPSNNQTIPSTINTQAQKSSIENNLSQETSKTDKQNFDFPYPLMHTTIVKYEYENKSFKHQTKRTNIKIRSGLFPKVNELSFYLMPSLNQTLFGSNADYQDHIEIRKNAEKITNGYSSGFFLKHYLTEKYFLETGLNLSYIYSKIKYHTVNKFYDEENSYYIHDTTWQIIGGNPVDSIAIIDSTFFPVYANKNFDADSKQEYQYFSIPLLLGMKIIKKNFEFEISLGTSIGWIDKKEGEILNFNNQETISLKKTTRTILFQQMGRIRIGYRLNKNYRIFFAPQYTFQINTLNKTEYPIQFRFINYGIGVGFAYKF